MSLDWNIRKVRDHEELFTDAESVKTQAIVFGCISTGIGKLTDDTVAEYTARAEFLQLLDGPWLMGPDGGLNITASDIRRRIGLETNVFPAESRTAWVKRVVSGDLDRRVAAAKREAEKAAADAGAGL